MSHIADAQGRSDKRSARHDCDAVAVVEELLARAVEHAASDIHFEPVAKGMIVKLRVDGMLSVAEELPGVMGEKVVSRLKVLAGLLTYRNDIPQEGRLDVRMSPGRTVTDQPLSVFPTVHGQRAVVRLFYDDAELADLSQLGLPGPVLEALERIAGSSQGVLLMTGPAGSGKSTTLAAVLRHLVGRFPGKSIVAVEDPVERHIAGVTQVQISPHGQMTFPVALRSLLRQDPEVLMVGEIRDAETARIALEAGLTGHLLMSTMHSGTPAGALLRLLEMGVEPYHVTSSVRAVVNQRLVRRLCLACRRRDGRTGAFEPVGCAACLHTGFHGRALIAEMMHVDGPLRKAVLAKADLETLEGVAASASRRSLRQAAEALVATGVTARQEVLRVCGSADKGDQ